MQHHSKKSSLPELTADTPEGLKLLQQDWASRMLAPLPVGASAVQPEVYVGLLFGTIDECLSGVYPYCWQVVTLGGSRVQRWDRLVDDFRRAHPNVSPLLLPAVSTFSDFLSTQTDLLQRAPYLVDLAAYEWAEAEIENAPDADLLPSSGCTAAVSLADLLNSKPWWNHCAILLELSFDIPAVIERLENIRAKNSAEKAAKKAIDSLNILSVSTLVLIYRDPSTWVTRFFSLTPLTTALLQTAAAAPSYQSAIAQLIDTTPALQAMPPETVQVQALAFFNQCLSNGILLGSVPLNPAKTTKNS